MYSTQARPSQQENITEKDKHVIEYAKKKRRMRFFKAFKHFDMKLSLKSGW